MAKKKKQKKAGGAKPAPEADINVSEQAPAKKASTGPVEFLQQVRAEGRKVTWTSRNETFVSTIMVLVMVLIMSLFFLAVDQVFRMVVPFVLNLF